MNAKRTTDNPHSTWKVRKQVPLPLVTYDMAIKYRDAIAADLPPGVFLSMHSAIHHALSVAASARGIDIEGATNAVG